jgi:transcriptional regulatory protein RtcR
MKPRPRTVVFGLIGPSLDRSGDADRWDRWRPTVALCQHEDLLVHRLELLYQRRYTKLLEQLTEDIRSISPETEVRAHAVELADPWDFELVFEAFHGFVRGYTFDPENEDYLVHITTGTHVAQICLFLLTESRHFPARLLQTSPPKNAREGGPGTFDVIDLDLSRYDRIATRFAAERQEAASILKSGIETRNAEFNRLIDRIEHVAVRSKAPLLLMGPTGAGKSHLAQQIYALKKDRRGVQGPFVEVNCATLRGDAAMSALFGHVKGAFTGAVQDRPGLLRQADDGVLFLDEIGELGLDEQAMLLRAVEEKRFLPVGSDREARSDFQLIAGTNRDLATQVGAGRFREDLLARIDLWTFRLPSLRERPEDMAPNLDYELERYARVAGARVTFNKEARERFLRFATSSEALWTRNFRDLGGAVTRMCTVAPGGRITLEIVGEEVARLRRTWRGAEVESPLEPLLGSRALEGIDLFDRMQLEAVVRVLQECRTISDAGRRLFAHSRSRKSNPNDADRLRKYLARFGLGWDQLARRTSSSGP